MKRKTFEELLTECTEAYFFCGDWRAGTEEYPPDYETLHRRAQRARYRVLRAYRDSRKPRRRR